LLDEKKKKNLQVDLTLMRQMAERGRDKPNKAQTNCENPT